MIFIIFCSAIILAAIQGFTSNESQSVSIDDFFSQSTTKTIKLSDGVGTDSKG